MYVVMIERERGRGRAVTAAASRGRVWAAIAVGGKRVHKK